MTDAVSARREKLQRQFEEATKRKGVNSEIRAAEPTYPAGKSVSADKAREMVKRDQRELVRAAVKWHRQISEIEQSEKDAGPWSFAPTRRPLPPVHGQKCTTGVGKTESALEVIAEIAAEESSPLAEMTPVVLVPTHKLGEELVARLQKVGRNARLIRGRNAIDPAAPENQNLSADFPDEQRVRMCRNLEQVELAIACGARVSTTCCKYKPKGKPEQRCRLYDTCSHQKQYLNPPDVWIIVHELLFHEQGSIRDISLLFIDENFWRKGVFVSEKGLLLDDIATKGTGSDALDRWRNGLVVMLRIEDVGGLKRKNVMKYFNVGICTKALKLEWNMAKLPEIWPGMSKAQVAKAMKRAPSIKTQKLTGIWKELRALLADQTIEVSGRLVIERDKKGATVIKHHGIKEVRKRWQAPSILMSATLPDLSILKTFHPQIDILKPIEAAMPPLVRIRQVLNASVSGAKLKRKMNLKHMRRYILKRWIELGCREMLVICQLEAEEGFRRLEKKMGKMPANIHVRHFNAIEGLDQFRTVRGLILIGRTAPGPDKIETMTGALTGREPAVKAPLAPNGRYRWYPPAKRGIRLSKEAANRMGMPGVAVVCDEHPDAECEAVRWQICEGELLQALGRARAVNRTAESPLDIDIVDDVVLPVDVDEVLVDEEISEAIEGWASDGVMLSSPTDLVKAWPDVWSLRTAERTLAELAAKCPFAMGTAEPRARAQFAVETLFKAIAEHAAKSLSPDEAPGAEHAAKNLLNIQQAFGGMLAVHAATYQLAGDGQQPRVAIYDPARRPDLRAWLEAKLGPLALLEEHGSRARAVGNASIGEFTSQATATVGVPAENELAEIRVRIAADDPLEDHAQVMADLQTLARLMPAFRPLVCARSVSARD
jgi:putative DNA primase/helicase